MAKSKSPSWFTSTVFRKDLSIIAFVAIIVAIPLTVVISQNQQETRQQAAGVECIYAFNTNSICNSYCSDQQGKTCQQSLRGKWGCCNLNTTTPTSQPNTGIPMWCSRCSDTYKYCNISWQSTQSCTDTENAKYALDCSCTQGTIDCGLKGINTTACKGKILLPPNNPVKKTPVSPAPNQ